MGQLKKAYVIINETAGKNDLAVLIEKIQGCCQQLCQRWK